MDEEITFDMINYALEYEMEQAAWDMWVSIYPGFTEENFIPFSEFKSSQSTNKPKPAIKSWDEITSEIGQIVNIHKAKKRGETK